MAKTYMPVGSDAWKLLSPDAEAIALRRRATQAEKEEWLRGTRKELNQRYVDEHFWSVGSPNGAQARVTPPSPSAKWWSDAPSDGNTQEVAAPPAPRRTVTEQYSEVIPGSTADSLWWDDAPAKEER